MARVLQLDYPRKSHIVKEIADDGSVVTACGIEFTTPERAPPPTTFDLEKETYNPPVEEARCGNCPWGEHA